jgi:hypothetical protein
MNKFVFGALAFSASTLCFANESEEWPTLDREIENLASSLSQGGGGIGISGFIRSSYTTSSDVTVGGNDLGGFSMDNIRLNFDGALGDFNVHIAYEASSDFGLGSFGTFGTAAADGVIDAWVSMNVTEQVAATMGFFRPPFLGDSLRDEDELLFIDRTVSGDIGAFRDQGIMFSGNFDQLGWWVAAQNGNDSAGDDLALTARILFNAMGTGVGSVEGAYGAGDESNLTVAAGYYDDANVTDGTAMCFEADYTRGAMSVAADILDFDNGFAGAFGGETPWDLTFSYMFSPDTWEAAARWDDFDDSNDTTMLTLGVNRYIEGHAAKWQVNYSTITSDANANEADVIQVGLTVSV